MPTEHSGVYRHWKGGLYRLLHLAIDADTNFWVAVYQQMGSGSIFVRNEADFHGEVDVNGVMVPRFRLLDPEEAKKAVFDAIGEQAQILPKNAAERPTSAPGSF